jgi:tRNA G46 methylase TrmB
MLDRYVFIAKASMFGNSRLVTGSQLAPHQQLISNLRKHQLHAFLKPVQPPDGADDLLEFARALPLHLDAGCGTGESASEISRLNPETNVLAIDRSWKRLNAHQLVPPAGSARNGNVCIMHGDSIAVARWLLSKGLRIRKLWLLYPNPWPKIDQLKRRWHGHAAFPEIVDGVDQIELRTNWGIYAEEMHACLEAMARRVCLTTLHAEQPLSRFEAKYAASGHTLFQVRAER